MKILSLKNNFKIFDVTFKAILDIIKLHSSTQEGFLALCYLRLKAIDFSYKIPDKQQIILEELKLITQGGDINWELKNTLLEIDETSFHSQEELNKNIEQLLGEIDHALRD